MQPHLQFASQDFSCTIIKKIRPSKINPQCFVLFEWTSSLKKESEYPVTRDFATFLGLELIVILPLMRGTKLVRIYYTAPEITYTQEGIGINPELNAVTTMAPAASKDDSNLQGILKFHRTSSLGYRVHHLLPVNYFLIKST